MYRYEEPPSDQALRRTQIGNATDRSIVGLDLLRGLAAVEVFLGHVRDHSFVDYGSLPAYQHSPLTAALFALTRLGREAVLVFFVLSGFLIFGQIIRRSLEDRFSIGDYCVDRVTRIFLPLVPACIFTVILDWTVFGTPVHFSQLILNIAGLNGVLTETLHINAPLWTLAYEIWFYVVGGALGYLFGGRFRSKFAFIILGCGIAVFSVLAAHYLLFWMMAGLAVSQLKSPHRRRWALCGGIVAICGVGLVELGTGSRSFTTMALLPEGVSEFLVCAGIAVTIPFLCDALTNARLSFLRGPAKSLGAVSFSLYLFHYPVNSCLDTVFPKLSSLSWTGLEFFSLRVLICLGAVGLFYFAFERNTAAVRRYVRASFLDRRRAMERGS